MKDKNGNHINDVWDVVYGGIFSSRRTDGSNPKIYSKDYENFVSKVWKWTGIIILLFLILGIGTCSWYHHKYKCVKGHYHTSYDRFHNKDFIWHCDKKVLRSDYDKNPENYPEAEKCNCN